MKRILFAFLIILNIGIAYGVDLRITSQSYVENQVNTKQDEIPAVDTNTVITHTGTAGEIGQKAIYDSTGNYAEQQTSLVTAGDANTGITNALENEFVCVEEDTDGTCFIWEITKARQALLPSGYTALKYLESSGTQYINTGVTATNTTGLKVKFNRYIASDQVVVGVDRNVSGNFYVNPAGNMLIPFGENWSNAVCGTVANNTDYEVTLNYMNDRKRYVNGVSKLDITQTLGLSSDIYLFAGNYRGHGPNWLFKGRVYYLKITDGPEIIRDFVAARRNSDDVLGMYDLVTGVFLTNAGSGTFVAGPVASYIPGSN